MFSCGYQTDTQFLHTKDSFPGVWSRGPDRRQKTEGHTWIIHVRSDTNLQKKMKCHLLNALPSLVGSFHLLHETCLIFFLNCPWGQSLLFMVNLDGPWLLGFGWRLYILYSGPHIISCVKLVKTETYLGKSRCFQGIKCTRNSGKNHGKTLETWETKYTVVRTR